jgi:hypothetical protein
MLLVLTLMALYTAFGGAYYLYRRGALGDFGLIAVPLTTMFIIGLIAAPQLLPLSGEGATLAELPDLAQVD